eukprot:COSAG01_NODE_27819_length_674_cov_0.882149_1_plen_91_part_00
MYTVEPYQTARTRGGGIVNHASASCWLGRGRGGGRRGRGRAGVIVNNVDLITAVSQQDIGAEGQRGIVYLRSTDSPGNLPDGSNHQNIGL